MAVKATATANSTPGSLGLSPEEQYLLMKLQIERELQDEILKWAQTRFWILAGVSVVVGFFGVQPSASLVPAGRHIPIGMRTEGGRSGVLRDLFQVWGASV